VDYWISLQIGYMTYTIDYRTCRNMSMPSYRRCHCDCTASCLSLN